MPFTASGKTPAHSRPLPPLSQVRRALQAGELRLLYHPIVSLTTGRMRGVEALLRWEHPEAGLLAPADFLPGVEDTPVMHEITRWVLRAALLNARQWPTLTVSVNVSFRDVTRADLVQDVDDALENSGAGADRLVLELTEQAMVQNLPDALRVLGELRMRGVGLSLDDFGTGISSLLYLRDLPITELKIDRTFLARVLKSDEDLAIVTSVAKLGRFMGLEVVAEGLDHRADPRRAHRRLHLGAGLPLGPASTSARDQPSARPGAPEAVATRGGPAPARCNPFELPDPRAADRRGFAAHDRCGAQPGRAADTADGSMDRRQCRSGRQQPARTGTTQQTLTKAAYLVLLVTISPDWPKDHYPNAWRKRSTVEG
jgi:EAL domain-containing protein (putative c-di-GMP-specific phosphodiesterase class I)